MRLCHPALLLDATIAIERHIVAYGDRNLWISYDSICDMVNRIWTGTSAIFTTEDIKKAIRELQAIDTLTLDGRDSSGILVSGQPLRPSLNEEYAQRFYGSLGSYDNPTPFTILRLVFEALPLPHRTFNPGLIAEELHRTPEVVVKVMRELRLMNDFNYRWSTTGYATATSKRSAPSYNAYEKVFGITTDA